MAAARRAVSPSAPEVEECAERQLDFLPAFYQRSAYNYCPTFLVVLCFFFHPSTKAARSVGGTRRAPAVSHRKHGASESLLPHARGADASIA